MNCSLEGILYQTGESIIIVKYANFLAELYNIFRSLMYLHTFICARLGRTVKYFKISLNHIFVKLIL